MANKPVVYAKLKAPFHIPNIGQVNHTLPPENKMSKMPNLKMELQDNGTLLLTWDEGAYTKSYTVAQSNIDGCLHPAVAVPVKTVAPKAING